MKGTQSTDKKQSETTTGEYEVKLEEIRGRIERNAETDVLELYVILTEKEEKKPKEAKKLLEYDLGDLYSKDTILRFLPEECKDEVKAEAGKKGRAKQIEEKNKIKLLADGSVARDERAEHDSSGKKESKSGSSRSEEQEPGIDTNADIEELQNRIANLTNDNKKANEAVVRLKAELEQQKKPQPQQQPQSLPQLQLPPNKVLLIKPPEDCRWVLARIPTFDEQTLAKAKPLDGIKNLPSLQETIINESSDLETCYKAFTDPTKFVTSLKVYHETGTTRLVRALVLPIERREEYYKED